MKIACIAADLDPLRLGGAEVHAVEVIRQLAKRHQITLFVGKSDAIKNILPKNITVIPVSYPQIPNFFGLSYIVFGFQQIKQYLDHHPVDIVWGKQCFPQAVIAQRIANACHLPCYITAQNPYLLTEELVVKGSLLQPFHTIAALMLNQTIAWAFKRADCVAAVSHYSKKAAQAFGAKHTCIIPNGYDPHVMKPAKKTKHIFTIITTSSLIPRNGIDILIKAVALLPKELPWQLIIAGDGPELEKLQKLNYALNPKPSQISFLGRVKNDDIPGLLNQADIFVRPSRFEGFGVSFVEAMACGLPIVGTMVGGIPDFLIPDKTGLAVPSDNVTALTHAITKLMKNPQLCQSLAKNAEAFVSTRYTWDIVAEKVESTMLSLTHTLNPNPSTLIVTPIYPPEIGGPATYVPEVAKRLSASVIAFSNHYSSDQFISTEGNTLIRQTKLLSAVWKQLKHHRTLYIQGTIVVGLTAFLGRLMGKRVVIKFVGDEVWEAAHSGKTLEEYYNTKPQSIVLTLHRLILRSAHQIIVPSTYLKDFIVKYHFIDSNHITVIPNATEIPKTIKLPASTQRGEPNQQAAKLIFVGRLVPWKHVDEIIKAVEIARKDHPWELTIVGDGPEKDYLPKQSFITYKGQLSKLDTLNEIANSRALLLYSSYEGHPHTVLEAHALGVPTIVSAIPPHRDLGSFAVVAPHDPKALAKAINSLVVAQKITPPTPPTWSDHMAKLVNVLK